MCIKCINLYGNRIQIHANQKIFQWMSSRKGIIKSLKKITGYFMNVTNIVSALK